MPIVKELPSKKLRAGYKPEKIPYVTSEGIESVDESSFAQPRAVQALNLGVNINDRGYNIYLAGEPNLGRNYMLRKFLKPIADKSPTPDDILYVYNFNNADKPKSINVPAGVGMKLKHDLSKAVQVIRREIPAKFDHEFYLNRRHDILDKYRSERDKLLEEMEVKASDQGFNMNLDEEGGLTLYPLIEGKLLSEEEFERLAPDLRDKLKKRSDKLMSILSGLLRKMSDEEQELREDEKNLDQEIIWKVLEDTINPLIEKYAKGKKNPRLKQYFEEMKKDIVDNFEVFLPQESQPQTLQEAVQGHGGSTDDYFARLSINVFVDNSETKGVPIVGEDHPTLFNLIGCIEREAEMGALVTDYSLIKSGALQRANKGFLILNIEDLLQNTPAWEALLRALRSGEAKIEDYGDGQEQTKTKTIEPEPVPLQVKVIIIGTDEVYEMLWAHEDRFPKLFKIKAHLQDRTERNAASIKRYLGAVRDIIKDSGLLHFNREALAELVVHSSRLAENQKKLSLKFPLIRELMIEASAMAGMDGKKIVDEKILKKASHARDYRSNLYEEEFMEDYDRELIKTATDGEEIGRVNGLSVTWFGEYELGLPHQIACTVGVGYGGVMDLEREALLGGPIHTKAMMILKSYLTGLFAQDKPLILTGSLCFEQSYAHIEGDSASGAELAALLSALAMVPIKLSMAFTGAVNQSGRVLAVGGVTRKIEGFFEVCRRHGLTGRQGVLIPWDNRDDLMLKEEVVDAVSQGNFHVYPVKTIEEAMELLTGVKVGKKTAKGGFPKATLYDKVNKRLALLAAKADEAMKMEHPARMFLNR